MITTRRTLIPLAVAAVALPLAACGTDTLDTRQMETELRDQLSADAGVDPKNVSVSCPEDVEIEKGGTFECELTAPNGDKVRVDVTMTDEDGSISAVVPPQQFEESGR